MATLLVGYDLIAPGKDYKPLWERLKSYGNWWHHLDSTWIVIADLTAVQLRDELKKLIDSNDELLVVNVTGDTAAWTGFNTKGSQWLKTNL
jgi:hypothetical protein